MFQFRRYHYLKAGLPFLYSRCIYYLLNVLFDAIITLMFIKYLSHENPSYACLLLPSNYCSMSDIIFSIANTLRIICLGSIFFSVSKSHFSLLFHDIYNELYTKIFDGVTRYGNDCHAYRSVWK